MHPRTEGSSDEMKGPSHLWRQGGVVFQTINMDNREIKKEVNNNKQTSRRQKVVYCSCPLYFYLQTVCVHVKIEKPSKAHSIQCTKLDKHEKKKKRKKRHPELLSSKKLVTNLVKLQVSNRTAAKLPLS